MSEIKKLKKNIGIILEDPRIGGPHKQLIYFINSLAKKDLFDKKIVLLLPKNLQNEIKNSFVIKETVNIKYLNFRNILTYLFSFYSDISKIKKYLKKNKIDILYVSGGIYCLKSIIAGFLSNKKVIWHIHDTNSNPIIKFISKIFFNKVKKIIFVSEKSKKYYLEKYDKKAVILNSSIDTVFFKKKKKFKNNYLNVSMIANINPDKDILTFLKVVQKINFLSKDVKFNLYGKIWNSQKNYFMKCNNFIFQNKIKNLKINKFSDNIKDIYNKSDIIVCTSKNESLPLVICEAMSMSLPILSTDVGDIKKYVNLKNLKSGFIFNQGDFKSFSNKILLLKNNKKLLKKLGENSRKVAIKKFDIIQYKYDLLNIITK